MPEDEQLRLARLVQSSLLPPPLSLPGLKLAARVVPSVQVGGDFLDYFPLGPEQLGFYLGDVQGKGVEGALYALLISGLMRGLHKTGVEPVEVLSALNRRLCFRSVPGKFCCLSYGVFDLARRELSYASAGLPFPLLLRDRILTRIELTGSPAGLFNPSEYDQVTVSLQAGDRLLFYTDGVSDCFRSVSAPHGDGEEELGEFFAADSGGSAEEQADRLVAHLQALQSSRGDLIFDDATLLLAHLP